MGDRRKNAGESDSENEEPKRIRKGEDFSCYEQMRDQRIKENQERMQKLGLLDLSLKLKSENLLHKKNPREKKTTERALPPNLSPRRSSRIKSLAPIKYFEGREKPKSSKNLEICIPEGTNPEIYTEEHEKLLGDCNTSWELYVDGYDEDGDRIYDPINGQTCHQCRQKTLGLHSYCGKCELLQGQFCGDCLYTRYGENILETTENPKWICPVCRGICNCSRCRKVKGWMPTGNLYKKILWPGGTFFLRLRTPQMEIFGSGIDQKTSQTSGSKISKSGSESFEQQLEAARRANDIKKMLLDGAPAALVSLIGQKQYRRCARDIYNFSQSTICVKQLSYSILELVLISIFPEMRNLVLNVHQHMHVHQPV